MTQVDEGSAGKSGNLVRIILKPWFLPAAIATGLIVRLALLKWPSAYHADEMFQYLEQAHRLVFGYGATPWEYRLGIRNWLFPTLISGPMRLGAWLAPVGDAYLLFPKLCLVLVSMLSVWAAWTLGRRVSARHGWAAALVAALWPEFAIFAGQALTDSVAVPLILVAAALLEDPGAQKRLWKPALVGALLALAALLRVQYAPAEAVLVAVILWRQARLRAAWWIAGGGVIVLAAYAAFEVQAGRIPFAWIGATLHQNLTVGRSLRYGEEIAPWYLGSVFATWTLWTIPLVILSWIGARRYPALMAMAIANVLVHSAIGHKEYRFIMLSTMTLVVLAAIGSVDWARARPGGRRVSLLAAFWITAALASLLSPVQIKLWTKATPGIQAYRYVRKQADLCGLGHYEARWSRGGGYAYLHRPIPIYLPDLYADPEAELASHQGAFNYLIALPAPKHPLPAGYRREACFGAGGLFPKRDLCVYRRPGPCRAAGAAHLLLDTALIHSDR